MERPILYVYLTEAMQEELLQFKMQKVWILVDLPHGKRAIGHTQEEGIDFEEVFAPVARIKAIRLFLAYASFMGFMVYQMDIKSSFLYETIKEEVYVCQPPGFEDPDYPDKVYKVVKALYGLHQAPRAWYETLAIYLLENGFHRGHIDQTLFIKKQKGDILLVQIFVDDIIFGPDIMFAICACAYFQVTPKVSHLHAVKRIFRYLKGKLNLGLWYPKDSPFDLVAYSNSDYAVVATSSTEAEYVAGASCCAQVLWVQNQMLDYGLQALVDKKRVVVTEAAINNALHLDDAEGVDCLPNEEIFTELARMGYEKPTTKLTFYKAFFSSQWKFLIHTILQSMSAKRTSWNEFSSAMASAVVCVSTGDLSTHSIKYISPALTQKVFANIRRVGKECLGVETSLFKGMIVAREPENQGNAEEQGDEEEQGTNNAAAKEHVTAIDDVADQSIQSPTPLTPPPQQPQDIPSTSQVQSPPPQQQSPPPAQPQVAQDLEILKLKTRVKKLERANKVKTVKLRRLRKVGISQRIESSDDTLMEDVSNQGREFNKAEDAVKETKEVREYTADTQVKGRQADIYHIDMDHATKVLKVVAAVSEIVSAAVVIPVVPETISVVAIPTEWLSGIQRRNHLQKLLLKPPPRIREKEVAMDHVKQKAKEEPFIQRYQVMKKRPQTKAQARRNMIMYLKNTAGFRLDYFKGMTYDDIRPIFMAKYNANIEFLLKSKEQMEEEESRAIALINQTLVQKAAKRRKLIEEAKEAKSIKQHLQIVPDKDDDVFTEATPLTRKVPVVDYQVILVNNKLRYKIIKADDTYQLYASFITILENFDTEDLETLWRIFKERFSTSKPNNFSDEYLLTPLKTMFERPDGQDNVCRNQSTVQGQALVKSWKLLTSYGVHIISFNTTQIILLVERKYPLTKFTLEQMLNVVRLQVEEESEMSLELIRFTRQ
nr:putative ribonuclease H-like domain-containing protein [Tanacetum cinerariifolium]